MVVKWSRNARTSSSCSATMATVIPAERRSRTLRPARLRGELVAGEAGRSREHEDREVAVLVVGVVHVGGEAVEQRTVARAHEGESATPVGEGGNRGALVLEPARHVQRVAAPDPGRETGLAEAVLVIPRELPGHERRGSAAPEEEAHEGRGQGEEPRPPRPGRVEPSADRRQELRPRLRRKHGAQAGAQISLERGLVPAGGTGGEVLLDGGPIRGVEQAVHPSRHELGPAGHGFGSASAPRRRARPRWMRDITVPAGTCKAAAISA